MVGQVKYLKGSGPKPLPRGRRIGTCPVCDRALYESEKTLIYERKPGERKRRWHWVHRSCRKVNW